MTHNPAQDVAEAKRLYAIVRNQQEGPMNKQVVERKDFDGNPLESVSVTLQMNFKDGTFETRTFEARAILLYFHGKGPDGKDGLGEVMLGKNAEVEEVIYGAEDKLHGYIVRGEV